MPLQTPCLLPSKKKMALGGALCHPVSECGQEGFPGYLGSNPFFPSLVIREIDEWYRCRNLT